jgi:hypothetical protein
MVTILGVWLGYEMDWIRQRRTVIGDPQVQSSNYSNTEAQLVTGQILREREYASAPWPLRWMGEPGYAGILLGKGASENEVARVRGLFPETDFVEVDGN